MIKSRTEPTFKDLSHILKQTFDAKIGNLTFVKIAPLQGKNWLVGLTMRYFIFVQNEESK